MILTYLLGITDSLSSWYLIVVAILIWALPALGYAYDAIKDSRELEVLSEEDYVAIRNLVEKRPQGE